MTVAQLQSFGRAFYRGWDQGYAERLRVDFGLSAKSKLRTLSKGQRARAGLMLALSYRPALLLLDEPSSGLDPIVRREILTAIVRSIAGEGRTVLFSSHLLGEVERMSDRIAMIQDGRIVMNSSVDDILSSHIYLTLRFKTGLQAPPTLEGLVAAEGCGRDWRLLFRGARPSLELESRLKGADVLDRRMATLDEIFVGYARADKQKENGEEVRN
jgi:ABC-2 type transport system ATP-binding protein